MKHIKGMDVSMLYELESLGAKYFYNGVNSDIFSIFKETGVNTIRLRLWHNPYTYNELPYGGGTNDLLNTISLAKRAISYGLDFILNIHYSDFWTDPKKQIKPKAWTELSGETLKEAVYFYTKRVLQQLRDANIEPKFIQIGNEITKGFLWPDGHIDNRAGMVSLLKAGIRASREHNPDMKIILHLDYGTDNELYRNWFSIMEEERVDYDIIAMSYYPFWNGKLEQLLFNMNDISSRFGKEIIIAETAIGYTTDNFGCNGMIYSKELEGETIYSASKEEQARFLKDLIDAIDSVNHEKGLGFIYWEPSWIPIKEATWATKEGCIYTNDQGEIGNSWANQALFDEHGNANPALIMLKDI